VFRIGVRFSRKDLGRWVGAVRKVKKEAYHQTVEMSHKCAVDYYQMVQRNIMFQKYTYHPLEERYAEWKASVGADPGKFWWLFGDLMQALTAFTVPPEDGQVYGSSWMGGIPAGIRDSGGKSMFGGKGEPRLIALYGSVNERRRPLFRPTAMEFAQKKWKRKGRIALGKIKGKWW
jgi:hypothetical protein